MHGIPVLKRLFAFSKRYARSYVGAGLLTLMSASADLAAPLALLILIDKIIPQKNPLLLAEFATAFLGLYFVRSLFDFVKGKLLITFRENVVRDLQRKLYETVQSLPVSIFDQEKSGYLSSRILNDTTSMSILVGETAINAFVNFLIAAGTISIVFLLNWKLTLIALSVVPAFAFGIGLFNKYIREVSTRIQEERSRVYADIQENLLGIRFIKAFCLEKFRSISVEKSIDANRNLNVRLGVLTALSVAVVLLCTTFAGILILWYGSYQVITSMLTLGQLMAFSAYTVNIFGPIRNLMGINVNVQTSLAAADRVFELIDKGNSVERKSCESIDARLHGTVRFQNVTFGYEPGHRVLENIDFDVEAGSMVALVGESGAGKSTLLNLLARFYDSYDGRILIDGTDIRLMRKESLLSQFGIVMQDTFLFSASIYENISYGNLTATEAEIVEAAKAANAHQFIMELPAGYQTQVGERGMRLSGGEKQRIAIARAILRNPKILILDEATSSLDSKSENLVKEALKSLMRNRTTFIIAHRFSTVLSADKIVVLEKGKIAAIGPHEQLYANSILYRQLYDQQLFSRREDNNRRVAEQEYNMPNMIVRQDADGKKFVTIQM